MTGIVSVIMIFSIPIIAILTGHFQSQNKIKHKMIQDQIELEKLKHENYLIETEKMKLELEHMKLEQPKDKFM
jgi:competence protein ComGC